MSGTRPTRRVLRPGVEKSTPFSGGRYQDDQPYHHLPFPLPCVSPPSPRSSLLRRTPVWRASSPSRTLAFGEKFRFSAAFCRGGAIFAVKNHPFVFLPSAPPPHPRASYTYANHPFILSRPMAFYRYIFLSLFSYVYSFGSYLNLNVRTVNCMYISVRV